MPLVDVPGQGLVEFPDTMTDEEIGRVITAQRAESLPQEAPPSALDQMGFGERALAGFGQALTNTGRGIKGAGLEVADLLTGGNRAPDYRASYASEQPYAEALQSSGGGLLGNVAGSLAQLVGPGALLGAVGKAAQLPRVVAAGRALAAPTSYRSAIGTGVALSAAQPADGLLDRGSNALLGGALGFGGTLAPRAIAGGAQGLRSLVEPLTAGGQERIVGRTLQRFASDPSRIANATGEIVPGSQPTLAQATLDPGLARLEKAAANTDTSIGGRLKELETAQNQARIDSLAGIAGDPAQLRAAEIAREQATRPLYRQFERTGAQADVTGLIGLLDATAAKNAQRVGVSGPLLAVRETLTDAAGNPITDPVALANASKNIGDLITAKGPSGAPVNQAAVRELTILKKGLDRAISKAEPAYGQAQRAFQQMSQPINQMQVGQEILGRATGNMTGPLRNQTFAGLLADEQGLVRSATGFKRGQLDAVLTSDQIGKLNAIRDDLQRATDAARLAATRGSDTAQNQISQNILRQTMGPLGLPQSFTEAQILERVFAPLDKAYSLFGSNQRVMGLLGDAVIDPKKAQQVLQSLAPQQRGVLAEALAQKAQLGLRASSALPPALGASLTE